MRLSFCLLLVLRRASRRSHATAGGPALRRDRVSRCGRPAGRSRFRCGDDGDALAQFFDWLKGSGWNADLARRRGRRRRGLRPLPEKAILLTFDDGYRSLYTRVFPLLKVYRFPAVAALVGSWMEGRPDGTVQYGDKRRATRRTSSHGPRRAKCRHRASSSSPRTATTCIAACRPIPQGSMTPSAVTWRYDPATGTLLRRYRSTWRASAATHRSRNQMAAESGTPAQGDGMAVRPLQRSRARCRQEVGLQVRLHPRGGGGLYVRSVRHPSLLSHAESQLGRDSSTICASRPIVRATRRIACLRLDALAAAGDRARPRTKCSAR